MPHFPSIKHHVIGSLLACLIASASFAQAPPNLQFIEKYLDSKTSLIGWIDPDKWNEDESKKIASLFGEPDAIEPIKTWVKTLREAEVKKIFFLSEIPFLIQGQVAVIAQTENPQKTVDWINTNFQQGETPPNAVNHIPKLAIRRSNDSVIVGVSEQIVSSIVDKNGELSQNLRIATAACKGTHGVVFGSPENSSMMPLSLVIPQSSITDPNGRALLETLKSLRYFGLHGELPLPLTVTLKLGSAKDAQDFVSNSKVLISSLAPQGFKLPPVSSQDDTVQFALKSSSEVSEYFGSLISDARAEARSTVSMNNLKQLILALHIFHDEHDHFPPQALVSKEGKKLLSWRVLILPYIEQKALYDKFHLDEAWDSEHNKKLIDQMPAIFGTNNKQNKDNVTCYVAPLTSKSIFGRKGPGIRFADITDGTSDTIALVETSIEKAVIWTKPEDVVVNENDVISSLFGLKLKQFNVAFADGSVRRFDSNTKSEQVLEQINIDFPPESK